MKIRSSQHIVKVKYDRNLKILFLSQFLRNVYLAGLRLWFRIKISYFIITDL